MDDALRLKVKECILNKFNLTIKNIDYEKFKTNSSNSPFWIR
jgi:hypothetical protein